MTRAKNSSGRLLALAAASIIRHTDSLVSGFAGFSGGLSAGLSAASSDGFSFGFFCGFFFLGLFRGLCLRRFFGGVFCHRRAVIRGRSLLRARSARSKNEQRGQSQKPERGTSEPMHCSRPVQPVPHETILDSGLAQVSYR